LVNVLLTLKVECVNLIYYYFLFFNYALQLLRFIVRSWLDVLTSATRRLHARHHATAPNGGRWKCGREMSSKYA